MTLNELILLPDDIGMALFEGVGCDTIMKDNPRTARQFEIPDVRVNRPGFITGLNDYPLAVLYYATIASSGKGVRGRNCDETSFIRKDGRVFPFHAV